MVARCTSGDFDGPAMVILVGPSGHKLGLQVGPASAPLLLIGAGFFTPTLGLWSGSPSSAELLMGLAFLIAAFAVAAYLLPRVALVLTNSGVAPLLRRKIPWDRVEGFVVSPNGASVLPSWVVVAVTSTGSEALQSTAGYSMRAVERRRAALSDWHRTLG